MLRVLVVEDEEMIRKGIVLATDWQSLGCVVVGEAANGEEGILQAEDMQAVFDYHGPQNAEDGRAGDDLAAARGGLRGVCDHSDGV